MAFIDVILLTQKLLSFNTINPPGNEMGMAKYVGGILSKNGFSVEYSLFEENRLHVIADKGLSPIAPPLVLSGHFDTVPLGAKKWSIDPFEGKVLDGKIFGRGSSDMKGGVAAMLCASIRAFYEGTPEGGVRLILTAGEELGCQGVQHLINTHNNLGKASAIIIGEPTANFPFIGHKGALYINVSTSGIAAHSSMPELGDNAIYKAARAISKIEKLKFGVEKDPLLGFPTINVGKMNGGMNLNSVPDFAQFTIDVRSTTKIIHNDILERIKKDFEGEAELEVLVDMNPVSSNEKDLFVQLVYDVCQIDRSRGEYPKSLPYLTDGSVLQRLYKKVPIIILGPGQPEMAHQTDEFCYTKNILISVEIYKNIILKRRLNDG